MSLILWIFKIHRGFILLQSLEFWSNRHLLEATSTTTVDFFNWRRGTWKSADKLLKNLCWNKWNCFTRITNCVGISIFCFWGISDWYQESYRRKQSSQQTNKIEWQLQSKHRQRIFNLSRDVIVKKPIAPTNLCWPTATALRYQ